MPRIYSTVKGEDAFGRDVSKVFEMVATDFAQATTDMGGVMTALAQVTGARLLGYTLSGFTAYNDVVTALANRDEGVTLSIRKTDTRKHVLKIPCPMKGDYVLSDETVDLTDAGIIAYADLFLPSGSGGVLKLSDGESFAALLSGKLDV